MFKRFTSDTVLELLAKGILEVGRYTLTDHYLVVGAKIMDQTYKYLYDNGYISAMEISSYQGKEELGIIEINR